MRKTTLSFAILFALSSSAVLAQRTPESEDAGSAPAAASQQPTAGAPILAAPTAGSPVSTARDVGLDKVADDGISTKTVKAAPCSIAARETDGTTTCIGIPDHGRKSNRR